MRHASDRSSPGRTLSPSGLLGFTVLVVAGVLVFLGCLLGLYLEASGLGAPRDTGMRPGYSALLMLGAGAGILMAVSPVVALHRSQQLIIIVAVLVSVVAAVALVGVLGV